MSDTDRDRIEYWNYSGLPSVARHDQLVDIANQAVAEARDAQAHLAETARERDETVLCSLRYPDFVCHLRHTECEQEAPHHINACGRFLPKRTDAEIKSGLQTRPKSSWELRADAAEAALTEAQAKKPPETQADPELRDYHWQIPSETMAPGYLNRRRDT